MKTFTKTRAHLFLCTLLVCIPAAAWAGDKDANNDDESVIVVKNGDSDTSVVLEDGTLTIITQDGDDSTTHMLDVQAMGLIASDVASEVMTDLEGVLAELDDMQIQFRVGNDNRLNLSFDESEFELDLDEIMSQVSLAMEAGFSEFETGSWTSHDDRDDYSEDELRAELHDLKAEIKALRQEIKRAANDSE